jgi:hypothetical protein
MSNPPTLPFSKNNPLSLKKYEVSSHQRRRDNYSIKKYGVTKTEWQIAIQQGRMFAGSFVKRDQRQELVMKPIPFDPNIRQKGDFECPVIAPGSFTVLKISQKRLDEKEHVMDSKYEESLMVK